MSDRIAVFEHGRTVQVGSGEELYHRPATAFVAGFIGNSNLLRGSVAEREVRIMVRPEEIDLSDDGDASGTAIPITVRERISLGDAVTYEVTTRDGQNVVVREPRARKSGKLLEPGTDAFMHVASDQHRVYAATDDLISEGFFW